MSTQATIQLPFTTSHAFIVGINDYEHLSPLSTAVNDAEVLAATLANDHAYQVHPPLLNATRAEIMQLLEKDLPRLVGKEDRVLFYFAGHGIALDSDDDPKGYLVPVDAKPGEPETLLAMDDFHKAITELPCQHGLLILDCCFAGAFKWSTGFRDVIFDLPGVIYQERFYQYAQDPAWQVITSSASDQKAVDILSDRTLGMRSATNAEHSPFAAALLAGLAGEADTVPKEKGDGVITATELYTYLRDRVEDETTEHGKRQSPSMFSLQRHDKGQYIFLHPRHPLNLPPIPDRNPFMGLKSYNETDSNLFYGRDRVIAALVELAAEQPLVVVSGASGTGKSSVIKAGLLPSCRKNGWHILPIVRPGKNPMENLQTSLPDLTSVLEAEGESLLIIDQYEELITQCLHPKDRRAFEEQLATCLRTYPQLHIVISIRSDFEPQFEEGPLTSWWQKGRYVVPVFSQDELREVIIKPTVQEVLFFESDILVDKLLEAVNQAPGALPLLSFTLSELYHAYLNSGRTNRAFTLEDYEKLGGVVGALRTRANAIYDELDQVHQDSMRKLMLRMVSLEGGELASRRVASSDLVFSDHKETERVQSVAQELVNARLISTGLDTQGQTYYEPAHDALVRAWARLWEWIKAQGEGRLGLMYKLSLAVADYQEHQTNDYLWNDDPRLDLLLVDLQHKGHGFNAQEETFLNKSKALRQRNQRRRWAIIAAVMAGLVGLSVFALYEQGQAKEAQVLAQENEGKALDASALAAKEAENARMQADTALAAKARAEQSDRLAQLRADTALMERNNALWQTTLARRAQTRAEQSAREAKSAAAAAKARERLNDNPTLALNLALAAHHISPSVESGNILNDILSNEKTGFYKDMFTGYTEAVTSMAYSPDGQKILTGSEDGTAKLWSLSGQQLQVFDAETPQVVCVAFSPDGRNVLTGDWGGTVKIWNLSGRQLRSFQAHNYVVNSMVYSPDGQSILTTSVDKTAKLWSLSGEALQTFSGHEASVNSAAFSSDGQTIVTGSDDTFLAPGEHTIKLWNLQGQILRTFAAHQTSVADIAFSADGESIISVDKDGTVKQWNDRGELTRTLFAGKGAVGDIDYSSPELRFLTINDNRISLWNVAGEELQTYAGHSSQVNAVIFSPDGSAIFSGSENGRIGRWEIVNNKIQTFSSASGFDIVLSAAISPDGKKILTSHLDNSARLWDLSGNLLQTFNGHSDGVASVKFSPDGRKGLTGGSDGDVRLWDLNGRELQIFSGHTQPVYSVAFSPDGRKVLTGSGDNTARLWDLSGRELQSFSAHEDEVKAVAFSPDGKSILTGSADGIGRQWDLSGCLLQTFSGHESVVGSIVFAPDGQMILSGSYDGTAKLWDLSGRHLYSFPRHADGVAGVDFSPYGRTVVTADGASTASLWDLLGNQLRVFNHESRPSSITFSSNGEMILSTSGASAILWRNTFGEYLSGTLWNRVHKLTPEERAEYKIDWDY